MDIVIPYDGKGEGLKFVLRSIENYFEVGKVFLVTSEKVPWIQNVEIVNKKDIHLTNKDANLIEKVFSAIEAGISEDFIFWSDDQILLKKVTQPQIVYNPRNPFTLKETKWQLRMQRTANFILEKTGVKLTYNYDSHVPQPMNRTNFLKLKEVDYQSGLGFCICTLYFGLAKIPATSKQDDIKFTAETEQKINVKTLETKTWLGFNEIGYSKGGVKEYLEKKFPKKSRYEK